MLKLAAPGVGLPWIELIAARMMFGRFRRKHTREEITALFIGERDRVLKLAASKAPTETARPVLIKCLRGMEDSSRNWSVYMTLEHLRIVNAAVVDVIRALAADHVPPGSASTAAVKPAPGINEQVFPGFTAGCESFLQTVSAVADLRTHKCYAHPWFGPLDAAGWHAMAAFHMRLHRQQIESIIASLRSEDRVI
jgi:hypothetical protein